MQRSLMLHCCSCCKVGWAVRQAKQQAAVLLLLLLAPQRWILTMHIFPQLLLLQQITSWH
jgi:hypothetical protein